ncbi:hypothetical protein PQX77_019367 [Marasmius sp. AFHP31]|nr:hypothetical protein PQX77_019367 [Marasmius sp. AFHP31]
MAHYFSHARGTIVGDHASFQNVAGDSTITTNYNYSISQNEDRMIVSGRTIRKVIDSDIHFLRLLSSEILSVPVKPEVASTSSKLQVIKMKKMVQTAEIFGCPGRYTATTLEPVNQEDQGVCNEIVDGALQVAVRHQLALLTQVFAVAKSSLAFTMLSYNELVSGGDVVSLYKNKNWIINYYLDYIYLHAIQSLQDDKTLTFPVTHRRMDWSMNLKTLTWHYNPFSLSLNPPSESHLQPFHNHFTPLHQDTVPPLKTTEIVAHVEDNVGDFLYLIASRGGRRIGGLSIYVQNDLLTFGTIIDDNRARILAHFPSTPPPELFCQSFSPNVRVSYSALGRIDFSFQKSGSVKVNIDFGLCIPYNDRIQLHAAHLSQSLHLCDGCSDVESLVYIDIVGFHLEGIFLEDPTTCATPAYLFVPPLHTELINGMHCVRYPFYQSQFYWSHDLYGRDKIAEEDWERLGIPKLSVQGLIGTYWSDEEYSVVQEVLWQKGYNLDGRQYAYNHGYPKLILGNPHDTTRFQEIEHSESDSEPKTPPKPSHTTSPSASSHSRPEPPAPCDTDHEVVLTLSTDCPPTHWAKPGFLRTWYNVVSQAQTDDLDYSVVAC